MEVSEHSEGSQHMLACLEWKIQEHKEAADANIAILAIVKKNAPVCLLFES